jgi:uncharacterized membrane protein
VKNKMAKTVLGIFSDSENAENAINTLKDAGYNPKDISIIMKDKREGKEIAENTGSNMVEGAVSGATTGAILGGLAGLLASFVIPGLGAFFIGGPLAAALGLTGAAATTASGAATGALAGGLLGALTSLGLSEDEAKTYEEKVRSGGILLAVPARTGEEAEVESLLSDSGADDIKSVAAATDRGSKGGSGSGWFGDSEDHALAAEGQDVPGRGKGK